MSVLQKLRKSQRAKVGRKLMAHPVYIFIHQVMVASKKKCTHTKIYNKQIQKQK